MSAQKYHRVGEEVLKSHLWSKSLKPSLGVYVLPCCAQRTNPLTREVLAARSEGTSSAVTI